MQTESEFNTVLKELLEKWEYDGTIEWWERLQSARVETVRGGWMQLCRKGTADWIVAFYDKRNNLFILFIEGKSDSGMNVKREAQDNFMAYFSTRKNFKVLRTNLIEEVTSFIEDNAFDKDELKFQDMDIHMGLIKLGKEEW